MSLYSISRLEDMLGKNYDPLYNRIKYLNEQIDDEITARGQQNRVMVTDNGLSYLKRLLDLEGQGASIQSGINEIKRETVDVDQETKAINGDISQLQDKLERKDERIADLETRIEWLKARLEKAEQREERLLPGAREGIFTRIGKLFRGQSE